MAFKLRQLNIIIIFTVLLFFSLGMVPPTAAAPTGPGVAVLVFHQVTPGITNSVTMSPQDFTTTLNSLKDQGYNCIDLKTLHEYLNGQITVPSKSVLITFDDGYQDVYKYAHPILQQYQISAVMFPIAMYYDTSYRLPFQHIPHLSTDDTKAMQASGLWSFGGHSFDGHRSIQTLPGQYGLFYTSHVWLGKRQETDLEYQNRIDADLSAMVRALNSLSLPPTDFAPPSGASNETLQAILTKNGLRYVFVQGNRLNYPGNDQIYRLTATSPAQVLKDLNALFPNPSNPPIIDDTQNPNDPQHSLKAFSASLRQSIYHKASLMRGGEKI